MNDKKHYYITVDSQDIREISIPDSGIEYEIIASANEIKEIKELFYSQNKEAFGALSFLSKPFDEWRADDKRSAYDVNLIRLYRRIFELGTDETRDQIREMGILSK